MNPNIGNSENKETSTSAMLLVRYMPFQKIWPHTYPSTSNPTFHMDLYSFFCFLLYRFDIDKYFLSNFRQTSYGNTRYFLRFRHILHRYANEDVSLGAWFIGLDVEHIDDRRLCCGTPPGMNLSLRKSFLTMLIFEIAFNYSQKIY